MPWFGSKKQLSTVRENVFEFGTETVQTFGDPNAALNCLSPEAKLPIWIKDEDGTPCKFESADAYILFMGWVQHFSGKENALFTQSEFCAYVEGEEGYHFPSDDSDDIYDLAFKAKYNQHKKDIDHALRQSEDTVLVYDDVGEFNGWGNAGQGANKVGLKWMEQRYKLQQADKHKEVTADMMDEYRGAAKLRYEAVQEARAAFGIHHAYAGHWLPRDTTKSLPKEVQIWFEQSPFKEPRKIGDGPHKLKHAINQLLDALDGAIACRISSEYQNVGETLCINFDSKEQAQAFRNTLTPGSIVSPDTSREHKTSVILTKEAALGLIEQRTLQVESPTRGAPNNRDAFFDALKFETSARGQALGAMSQSSDAEPKPINFKMAEGLTPGDKRVVFEFANHEDAKKFGNQHGITVLSGKSVHIPRDQAQAYMEMIGVGKHTIGTDAVNTTYALEHELGTPLDKIHLEINRKVTNGLVREALDPEVTPSTLDKVITTIGLGKKKEKIPNYLGVKEFNIIESESNPGEFLGELSFQDKESAIQFQRFAIKSAEGANVRMFTARLENKGGDFCFRLPQDELHNLLESFKVPDAGGLKSKAGSYRFSDSFSPVHSHSKKMTDQQREALGAPKPKPSA